MIIEREEKTIISNTKDGLILADRYEKMLKENDISVEREESTIAIMLKVIYSYDYDLKVD